MPQNLGLEFEEYHQSCREVYPVRLEEIRTRETRDGGQGREAKDKQIYSNTPCAWHKASHGNIRFSLANSHRVSSFLIVALLKKHSDRATRTQKAPPRLSPAFVEMARSFRSQHGRGRSKQLSTCALPVVAKTPQKKEPRARDAAAALRHVYSKK